MNKYTKAVNDPDLIGLYKTWDYVMEMCLLDDDLNYTVHVLDSALNLELKRRNLNKNRFLKKVRKINV